MFEKKYLWFFVFVFDFVCFCLFVIVCFFTARCVVREIAIIGNNINTLTFPYHS